MSTASAAPRADVAPKAARAWLVAILVVAFVLRVVYVLQSRANPFFDDPQMDAGYHVEWARAFAEGRDFQPGPFFRAPLYPWFLGVLFKVFGDGLLLPRIVQALIGTVSCALVYAVGARAFDRRTGLVAAACAATYWIVIYFEGELLLPVLEVPCGLLVILCALRMREKPTYARAMLVGVTLGVAALVRPNFLILAPFLGGWIFALRAGTQTETSHHIGARFARALALLAGLAMPLAPVTAHNAHAGDSVLISSQGGVNLWIGNNPWSDGVTAIAPGTRGDWWGGFEDTNRQAEAAEGRALKPSEVSAFYTRKALAFWRDDSARALALLGWKLRLFWIDWELGNNQDERFFALRFGPILRYLPIGFAILAPLGLLGFVLAARSWRSLFPLWIFVPAYTASVVAFFVCARFRVPVLPVLMIFAAHALWWLVDAVRARRLRAIAIACAFLVPVAWCVSSLPRQIDRSESKGLLQLGIAAERNGDDESALEFYQRAIAENPRHANAHVSLGTLSFRTGRVNEAEASLLRALELDPRSTTALQALSDLYARNGRPEEAALRARALVAIAPTNAASWFLLGSAELARARVQPTSDAAARLADARAAFSKALELASNDEDRFNASFALGEVAFALGAYADALASYEQALRLKHEPDEAGWFFQTHARRLAALRALGRGSEATRAAQELVNRYAADPRARALLGP